MQPANPIVQLRDATLEDASFIARVVLAGIDMLDIDAVLPDGQRVIFEHLIGICRMNDTLYSYLNTRIAEIDDRPVGALVAYDGAHYARMREKTFGLVQQTSGLDLSRNAMETSAGEFYLDSMAILPDYRGLGIGKLLMHDRLSFALDSGFQKVTLLVDKDKPRLQEYYESIGFEFTVELFVFGSWYNKLKFEKR